MRAIIDPFISVDRVDDLHSGHLLDGASSEWQLPAFGFEIVVALIAQHQDVVDLDELVGLHRNVTFGATALRAVGALHREVRVGDPSVVALQPGISGLREVDQSMAPDDEIVLAGCVFAMARRQSVTPFWLRGAIVSHLMVSFNDVGAPGAMLAGAKLEGSLSKPPKLAVA
jgi:hypothetical protein